MEIDKVFDELYDDYTAKILRWVPCYKNMVVDIAQYLPADFSPKNILDLGCGNGNATQIISNTFPTANYLLVDASNEMILGCKERFKQLNTIEYQQAFFQDLKFVDQRFDLIVACLAIHHLKESEKISFFNKMLQWLKPAGKFLYSDLMIEKTEEPFHTEHLQEWKRVAFEQGTPEEEWQYLMEHYAAYDFPSDMNQQISWLKAAGFKKVNISFRKIGWTSLLAEV